MLSAAENKLLCEVGPGTPMGDTLRQFWLPIELSTSLPERDGKPLRIRVLGEDLVAFRDSEGTVALLEEHCAHRGASLYYGRNEDCGLRCVYHGWKFDAAGRCVDMPNEPPESNFKDKVRLTAYRCAERNGVIWGYLGPRSDPPELPALEWNLIPEDQRHISLRYEECNWAQALEGGIDSSHSGFLHASLHTDDYQGQRRRGMMYKELDKHPRFEVVDTDYGVLVGARRDAEVDTYYWRITQFLMPFYSMIPPYGESPVIGGHAWVPIDDHNTMAWTVNWHPLRPLTEQELNRMRVGWGLHLGEGTLLPATGEAYSRWRPKAHRANDYLIDWEKQKTRVFSGLPGTAMQDQAMQESMGPIYDRTREHLGASDTAIIQVRRRWLRAARALREQGVTPSGVESAEAYRVRSAGVVLPRGADWVAGAQDWLTAHPERHLASV
jgi:phenylpropionate dioxygenase-like ring-hydroxylating dioxygenase large terminal subunit